MTPRRRAQIATDMKFVALLATALVAVGAATAIPLTIGAALRHYWKAQSWPI